MIFENCIDILIDIFNTETSVLDEIQAARKNAERGYQSD